jgi:hypothetical protein
VSIEAFRWARKQRTGKGHGLLLVLGDLADARGYCFPSHKYLADDGGVSESTIRRLIKMLASRKLLTIVPRFRGDGSRTSNGYQLEMDPPVTLTGEGAEMTGRVFTHEQGACSAATPPLVNGEQETTTEPVVYSTPPQPALAIRAAAQLKQKSHRSRRELCFPKMVSAAQRQELEKLVAGLSDDAAQQVLDELEGCMASKQIRNPIRYCAALVASVRRGDFQPALGLPVADRRAADRQREVRRLDSVTAVVAAREIPLSQFTEQLRARIERLRPRRVAESVDPSSCSDESVDEPHDKRSD